MQKGIVLLCIVGLAVGDELATLAGLAGLGLNNNNNNRFRSNTRQQRQVGGYASGPGAAGGGGNVGYGAAQPAPINQGRTQTQVQTYQQQQQPQQQTSFQGFSQLSQFSQQTTCGGPGQPQCGQTCGGPGQPRCGQTCGGPGQAACPRPAAQITNTFQQQQRPAPQITNTFQQQRPAPVVNTQVSSFNQVSTPQQAFRPQQISQVQQVSQQRQTAAQAAFNPNAPLLSALQQNDRTQAVVRPTQFEASGGGADSGAQQGDVLQYAEFLSQEEQGRLQQQVQSGDFTEPLGISSGAFVIFGNIQSSFSCENQPYGYYADVENNCQLFHICNPVQYPDGISQTFQYTLMCGRGSVFDQSTLSCNHAEFSIPCQDSASYFSVNDQFGQIPPPYQGPLAGGGQQGQQQQFQQQGGFQGKKK